MRGVGRLGQAVLLALVVLVVAGCGDLKGSAAPSCAQEYLSTTILIRSCVSPDGRWAVHSASGRSDVVVFTRAATTKAVARYGADLLDTNVTWVKPHTLLFVDAAGNLVAVNPPAQPRTVAGGVKNFWISPDSRWIGVWRTRTGELLSMDGTTCRLVPLRSPANTTSVSFGSDSKSVVVTWELPGLNSRSLPQERGSQTPIAGLHQRCSARG